MCLERVGVLIKYVESEAGLYTFYCPGCKRYHPYNTIKIGDRPCWTFNGDVSKPTFNPSLLCEASRPQDRCHLYVRNGQIQYLSDCHHELAGKTVDMIPIEDVPERAW